MEQRRGGDQPSEVLSDVLLPLKTSGDFASRYLERVRLGLMFERGDTIRKLPFMFPFRYISQDENGYECLWFGGHCESDDRGANTLHTVYDITVEKNEVLDITNLSIQERASLQSTINKMAREYETQGDLNSALTLRRATLGLAKNKADISIGTLDAYSFSKLGGSRKWRYGRLYANGIIIQTNETDQFMPAIERGSEEWELDAALSTVTLGELHDLTDKLVLIGMLAQEVGESIHRRYPSILEGQIVD